MNTTQHLERVPREESSGFLIRIHKFQEMKPKQIEDKNPPPQLAEILGVSTKPNLLPLIKMPDSRMLNWLKLPPSDIRPDCCPLKIEDMRVAQEMTEARIVRSCLFPATTHPYILFPENKLLLKCYISPNSPWLLMQHFQISGDFHDFPKDRT
ncbi:hypothetical protein BHE74_00011791 [Ensete ventricosum]|uniref:Uncharacterized protein n=1 Tax=Ensete ventricosum TaxID=4639 RepID=A0A445MFY5_ENSVE|nr:hypothetical protein BHE74_00011791 [Ensete ventricosum]RZR73172.1 hypothetical protein BHM03_00020988 [Ensete ventricosum]